MKHLTIEFQYPAFGFFRFLLFLISVLTINSVWAVDSTIRFEHITTQDGLSQSTVRCILKDSQGLMWFGTADGLNKYNGYYFRPYKHDRRDSHSIIGNDIHSLCEDDSGNIWVGTDLGLSIYDRAKNRFNNDHIINQYQTSARFQQIDEIYQDSKKLFWIVPHDNGVYRLNPETNEVTHFKHDSSDGNSLSSNMVRALLEDHRGNIWFGMEGTGADCYLVQTGQLLHFSGGSDKPGSLVDNQIRNLVEDHHGNIWFGCRNSVLSVLMKDAYDSGQFIRYAHPAEKLNSLGNHAISSLICDREGGLWIGTINGGLNYLNPDSNMVYHYGTESGDLNSLNNNSVQSLYEDDLGDIWIGTHAGGINVIHFTNQAFHHYENVPGDSPSLSYNAVTDFAEDQDGSVWIGTDGGGLNRFEPTTGYFENYQPENSNSIVNAVLCVCIDQKNRIWLGTWGGGIRLFDKEKKTFKQAAIANGSLSEDYIFDLIEDRHGKLWLASLRNGLIQFDPETSQFQIFNQQNSGLIYNHVEVLKEDREGNLFIGTIYGLSIFSPRSGKMENYRQGEQSDSCLSNGFVTCFYEECSSKMWIGTMNGLDLFNKKTKTFQHFTWRDGLPSNSIQSIEKDNTGCLWISTNNGLCKMDLAQKKFYHYTSEDGLQGSEFIKKSSHRTKDGQMFFGGVNGFNMFCPSKLKENKNIPPVVLTDFHLLNKPVDFNNPAAPFHKQISLLNEIKLSYKQNVFMLTFAALNYVSSSKNRYMYMLEGFDSQWNISPMRIAIYTNIKPGKYVFRVKGSNNDGVWNDEGVSLGITITPPFWRTSWFRSIMAILCVIAVILVIQLRIQWLQKQNMILEKKVTDKTCDLEQAQKQLLIQERMATLGQVIATVAHEIRNPLGTIRTSIFSLKEALVRKESDRMDRAMELAERNIVRCDLIITELLDYTRSQTIKLEPITFDLWLKGTVQQQEIPYNVIVEYHLSANCIVNIQPDSMGRVVANIVSNALQSMGQLATTVSWKLSISTYVQENRLYVLFQDSGTGITEENLEKVAEPLFSTKPFGVGLGLPIVKKIMSQHEGGFEITSNDQGALVILWLPLAGASTPFEEKD